MTRNLKALGLALVAIFAMSAFMASAASALTFTATNGNYPVSYSGSQPASEPHKFSADGYTTECEVAKFSGTAKEASSTATVTPTYEKCTTNGVGSTVTMNGCDYVFHLGATNEATVDLVCPKGSEVTIDVATCRVNIPPFTNKAHVLMTNSAPNVLAKPTVTGITANLVDAFLCPFTSNTHTTEGSLTGGAVSLSGGEEGVDVG